MKRYLKLTAEDPRKFERQVAGRPRRRRIGASTTKKKNCRKIYIHVRGGSYSGGDHVWGFRKYFGYGKRKAAALQTANKRSSGWRSTDVLDEQ